MMHAANRLEILMTLMQQLIQIFEVEVAVLRQVDLAEIAELAEEKQALVDVYVTELRELRSEPNLLASAPDATRAAFEQQLRDFQAAAARNARALRASQLVVERVATLLRDGVRDAASYGAGGAPVRDPQVIPVAFDRSC